MQQVLYFLIVPMRKPSFPKPQNPKGPGSGWGWVNSQSGSIDYTLWFLDSWFPQAASQTAGTLFYLICLMTSFTWVLLALYLGNLKQWWFQSDYLFFYIFINPLKNDLKKSSGHSLCYYGFIRVIKKVFICFTDMVKTAVNVNKPDILTCSLQRWLLKTVWCGWRLTVR